MRYYFLYIGTSGSNRRLDQSLRFFFFFRLIHRLAAGINQPRGDEDDQVSFDVLIDIGAEEAADDRNVANDRRAIFGLLHVFAHQTTEHDGLAVPDAHARRDFAGAEDRLVDDVSASGQAG